MAESDGSNQLRLMYTHKLNNGTAPTDHYGIALAEVSSLPECVTSKAREYASRQSVNSQVRDTFTSIYYKDIIYISRTSCQDIRIFSE